MKLIDRFLHLFQIIISKPFLSVFVLQTLFLIIICLFSVFKGGGHVVFVDITEGLRLEDTANRVYSTYDDNWGEAIAEKQRVFIFSAIWGLFRVLGLSVSDFIPFRMLFSYVVSILGFVLMCKLMISPKFVQKNKARVFWAALIGGFIYLFNPWMTNRIMHIFLYMSSFTVPVFIGLTYKYFFYSKHQIYYLVAIGVLLGLFTTTPHTILLVAIPGTILLILALFKKLFKEVLLYILIILPLTLLTGAYWILPFVLYRPTPDRVESLTIVELLAKNANILNNLKLQGYWWDYVLPGYTFAKSYTLNLISGLIYFLGFGLFCISLIFIKKSRQIKFATLLFIASLMISTYTPISHYIFENIVFGYLKPVSWVFREIEKFAFLIGLSYSVGIFFVLTYIKSKKKLLGVMLIATILIFVYLGYWNNYVQKNMTKVGIPDDYYKINEILSKDNSEYNVTYYPQVQRVNWTDRIDGSNYLSNLSSIKPVVPNTMEDSYTINFVNKLLDENNVDSTNIGAALDMIGVKYLVVRKDYKTHNMEKLVKLLNRQSGLELVQDMEKLTIYKNNEYKGLLEIKDKKIVTNIGINAFPYLSFGIANYNDYLIDYSDLNDDDIPFGQEEISYVVDDQGALDIAMADFSKDFTFPSDELLITDPNDGWAKMSLTDKTHAETSFYFNNYNINSKQFNYGHEVALSLGGLHWQNTKNLKQKIIDKFQFENDNGFDFSSKDGISTISFDGRSVEGTWNIYSSNKVNVNTIDTLGILGEAKFNEFSEMHFKIRYYDAENKLLGTHVFYPIDRKIISNVFKIPLKTEYVDFSIWTYAKSNLPFEIKDLTFYSLGEENYSFPILKTEVQNDCENNCVLMARVLKSQNYPSDIVISIADGPKTTLKNTSMYSRYQWVSIGQVEPKSTSLVTAVDTGGIGSIAAYYITDFDALTAKIDQINNEFNKYDDKFTFNGINYYLSNKRGIENNILIEDYIKHKPTDYSFDIADLGEFGVLVFKKPYKRAWEIGSEQFIANNEKFNIISNGFWAKNIGRYNIYYFPQRYYQIGLQISLISIFMIVVFYMVVYSIKSKTKTVTPIQKMQ